MYMAYIAIFVKEKDGRFSVSVPSLPGCFSEGDNLEDAKKNIEEAIELYLEGENIEERDQGGVEMVISKLVARRDTTDAKFVSHKKAWANGKA